MAGDRQMLGRWILIDCARERRVDREASVGGDRCDTTPAVEPAPEEGEIVRIAPLIDLSRNDFRYAGTVRRHIELEVFVL